ncbi:hypothetical protein [Legionella sp. WA2022007384]
MYQKNEQNVETWANIWHDLTKLICAIERFTPNSALKNDATLEDFLQEEKNNAQIAKQCINSIYPLIKELRTFLSDEEIFKEFTRRIQLRNFHNLRLNNREHFAVAKDEQYVQENNKIIAIAKYILNNIPDKPGPGLNNKNFKEVEQISGSQFLHIKYGEPNAQEFTQLSKEQFNSTKGIEKIKAIKNNPQYWLGDKLALNPFLVFYHSLSDQHASALLNFVTKNPGLMSLIDLKIQSSEDLFKKIAFIEQNKRSLLWLFKKGDIDQIDIDQLMRIPQSEKILNFIYDNRNKLSSKEIGFILQHHQGIITDFGNQSTKDFNNTIKNLIEARKIAPRINYYLNDQLISPSGVIQLFSRGPSVFKANVEAFERNKDLLDDAIKTKKLILREGNILLNSSSYYIDALGQFLSKTNIKSPLRSTVESSNKYISELLLRATPQWKTDFMEALTNKKLELKQEDNRFLQFFTVLRANNKSNKIKAIDALLKELKSDSQQMSEEVLEHASVLLDGRTGGILKHYAEFTPLYKTLKEKTEVKEDGVEIPDTWRFN